MTRKLYWDDDRTTFEASSFARATHAGAPSIVLEETLFYPEGGGQLGDRGVLTIGGHEVAVVDTQIDDMGRIHHVLAEPVADVEGPVRGAVDRTRRLDHTIQHTAQHVLSRALADEAKADTVSARLGATACTIDVARPGIPDAELHRAEDLVNAVIASNVAVRTLYPDAAELARLPLRRAPKVTEGIIRIIDVEGFDMTPCGGTHAARTGALGQIRIVGAEKYKGMLRLTFHAGLRALADARARSAAIASLAADLTCGAADVGKAVQKLRADLKSTRAALDAARAELGKLVARELLAKLPPGAAPRVVGVHRKDDDVGALRLLAGELASDPRVVALAAGDDPGGDLVVVVQRGASAGIDCGRFVQEQAKLRGGRGGGRPERAEGRFARGTSLAVLVTAAETAAEDYVASASTGPTSSSLR